MIWKLIYEPITSTNLRESYNNFIELKIPFFMPIKPRKSFKNLVMI